MKGKYLQGSCKRRNKEVGKRLGNALATNNLLEKHKKIAKEVSKMLA